MNPRRIVLLLALLVPVLSGAQENAFSLNADFLTRGEIRAGGFISAEGEPGYAQFLLSRTRVEASYSRSMLSAHLSAQHAGTWGSNVGSTLSMHEAWAQLQVKGFFAKVGRQHLSYDDERIFGSDDWSMTGISHDALKIGFEKEGHKIHLIGSYNQDIGNIEAGGTHFSGGIQPYKSLGAAWYHWDIPKLPIGLSVLFIDMGLQPRSDEEGLYHQELAGAFLSWRPERWGLEGAYYHQWGKEQQGLPVDAWMASVKATARPGTHFSFRAGYDFLSGDDQFATPGSGQIGLIHHEVVRGFSSLYGSNHRFYGAMDFFYVSTYINGFTAGLQNLYAGVTWTPETWAKGLSVDAAYHFFSAATRFEAAKRALGHEAELSVRWKILPDVALSAGYSFMQGTDTMALLKRSSENNRLQWGWVMLQVSPRFFQTKW